MKTAIEILQERAKLIHQARAILDKAQGEGRDADATERESFDKIMTRSDEMKTDADRISALEIAEAGLDESQGRVSQIQDPANPAGEKRVLELRKSVTGMPRTIELPADSEQRMTAFRKALAYPESRALAKGVDAEGGYLSPPIEFMAQLIQARDNIVFMRQICNVLPPLMDASTLGAPTIDTDMSDADWTTEILIGSEDSALEFGRRDLTPNPLAKWIKITKTLLRRSTMSADTIVRDRLAKKFGMAEENAYLNGDGSGKPLGVFTASASGISTGRDVDDDNTTTAFTADGLINAQMAVKKQYRTLASWIFHRTAIALIRKLKDNDGRYLWIPSVIPNVPDTLLGDILHESEYAPNTFTAGLYVGIYGDFSEYWIVDALTMTIQILIELYAATNHDAYLGRLETDGAPVDEQAFARVTLAT